MTDITKSQRDALRLVCIGSVIAEYGGRDLVGHGRQDLKQWTGKLLRCSGEIQNWFLRQPVSKEAKAGLLDELFGNRIPVIAELLEVVWGLPDDVILEITEAVRSQINPPQTLKAV